MLGPGSFRYFIFVSDKLIKVTDSNVPFGCKLRVDEKNSGR